jgi:hypothetical protein
LEGIYFKEQYQTDKIDQTIQIYDEHYAHLGYYTGREVQPEKYPDFKGVYSWSEHSARRMADDSPRSSRPQLRVFLENRGFYLK